MAKIAYGIKNHKPVTRCPHGFGFSKETGWRLGQPAENTTWVGGVFCETCCPYRESIDKMKQVVDCSAKNALS